MSGLSIGWGGQGGHISMRICRRIARQPSAARCDVHFVDLRTSPLATIATIATRVPVSWETARDLASVEARVRDLPVEHWSDMGDRLARSHWCVVGIHTT